MFARKIDPAKADALIRERISGCNNYERLYKQFLQGTQERIPLFSEDDENILEYKARAMPANKPCTRAQGVIMLQGSSGGYLVRFYNAQGLATPGANSLCTVHFEKMRGVDTNAQDVSIPSLEEITDNYVLLRGRDASLSYQADSFFEGYMRRWLERPTNNKVFKEAPVFAPAHEAK